MDVAIEFMYFRDQRQGMHSQSGQRRWELAGLG
uniref:Uncharacterized protein n=1 Tax=Anguilla anguilla TaxID=7936 RepID=A0A0E9UNY5_ANGAN